MYRVSMDGPWDTLGCPPFFPVSPKNVQHWWLWFHSGTTGRGKLTKWFSNVSSSLTENNPAYKPLWTILVLYMYDLSAAVELLWPCRWELSARTNRSSCTDRGAHVLRSWTEFLQAEPHDDLWDPTRTCPLTLCLWITEHNCEPCL